MLVVDPERRLSLDQIAEHRWLTLATTAYNDLSPDLSEPPSPLVPSQQLDGVVVTHMLQLPKLTFDEIAESVHQLTFNHIFAIYHLLVDKLSAQHREEQRLQQHLGSTYSRYTLRLSMFLGLNLTQFLGLQTQQTGQHHDWHCRPVRKHSRRRRCRSS